jgi:hypothetical protein
MAAIEVEARGRHAIAGYRLEPVLPEKLRYSAVIAHGIVESGLSRVAPLPDHPRDALLGERGRREEQKDQ